MRKVLLRSIMSATLALSMSAIVQAGPIEFDPEQDSVTITVDNFGLSLFPKDPYEVKQYFHGGADDTKLDSGDLFTESFTYNFNTTTDNVGSDDNIFLNSLLFSFDLTGFISDVTYGSGGAPTLGDPDFLTDFKATSFTTNFTASANAMTVTYNGDIIGQFDLLAGVSTQPVALSGSVVSGFALEFAFNEAWYTGNQAVFENVWKDEFGAPLDPTATFALATGSAGPTGNPFNPGLILNDGNTYASVAVLDNGTTLKFEQVPEPTSLAIIGLGLLGLAGMRKRSAK
ncbi:PEP-CTERM sorting domain-containing protein [Alteromonadaceae bacterium BrNp21-10]|nr:PEP-CTERM sorting domain-containing protein [Alteromonadaceae bacterium BrNp21-10]